MLTNYIKYICNGWIYVKILLETRSGTKTFHSQRLKRSEIIQEIYAILRVK